MNEKSAYIQNLRIIATIIVVLGHATMLYDNWGYINVNHEQSDFFMKMRLYLFCADAFIFFIKWLFTIIYKFFDNPLPSVCKFG